MKKFWFLNFLKHLMPLCIVDEGGGGDILNGSDEAGNEEVHEQAEDSEKEEAQEEPEGGTGEESKKDSDAPKSFLDFIPEEKKELFKDFTEEQVLDALEKGASYNPLKEAEDLELDVPEGFNEEISSDIKSFAVEAGLTKEQASKAFEFWKAKELEGYSNSVEMARADLQTEFKGKQFDDMVGRCNSLLSIVEAKDPSIVEGLRKSGAVNNKNVIKLLNVVAKDYEEDNSFGGKFKESSKELTAEEHYRRLRT